MKVTDTGVVEKSDDSAPSGCEGVITEAVPDAVKPSYTSAEEVTMNPTADPSVALASVIVRVVVSSLRIVPVPVAEEAIASTAISPGEIVDIDTVNYSAGSTTVSS